MPVVDVAIIGGGIVGLATARELLARWPGRRLIVLEKERSLVAHQTSHNSGVIHSGIYYRPGSVKAQTCVSGARLLIEFCQAQRIPYAVCGKVVVATRAEELPALKELYRRGLANGVPGLSLIGPERLRELEPHARGVRALHVPGVGIVDYARVARAFADAIQARHGAIRTSARVIRLLRKGGAWRLETSAGDVEARFLITCAGLQADRVARMSGGPLDLQIVPFRGEYYELAPERSGLVKSMIYPVPDAALPFLGVHFTRSIQSGVHAGPNAVLALKREGYRKTDVDAKDVVQMVRYRGFWSMASRYWKVGLEEAWRSWSKRAFVRALQRLVPEVTAADLRPGASGVRAQAVDRQGGLVDDFRIERGEAVIHVCNVPSPAATASIRIGQLIADMAAATSGFS